MDKFSYVTQKVKNGPFERRTILAESAREAEKELMGREIAVLDLERVVDPKLSKKVAKKVPHVSLKEKISFAQHMEQCQEIDMGLLSALDICAEMAITPGFSEVCRQMKASIAEGTTLHDSMKDTGIFDSLVLGLVRAGEKSGFLAKAFGQIKSNYRRSDLIRKKVIKLMMYPLVVMFIASICVFFLMWKTVPTFVGLFSSAKIPLPLPTKILMFISNATVHYPLFVAAGLAAMCFAVMQIPYMYRKLPSTHNFVLKMPIFGRLQRLLIQETFTRTMYNLMSAGLKILDCLSLTRSVSTCYPFKGAIARAMLTVAGGSSLMVALENEKDIFGIILVRTLGFGEKTGKTEQLLEPLYTIFSQEIMDYIDNLNTIIEPLLTLFIGSIVLLIMLALFIPIFSLPKLI
jgi:type II secretory pathway component PulF